MARHTGPVCKICRREGEKLFLKGQRCYTVKCAMEGRSFRPGEHGRRRIRVSDYALQLREKQKLRVIYGNMEKQFRNYFKQADRLKGVTGEILLQLLERRLDNVVFRMRFSTSRAHARQLASHGNIFVNDRRVDIPSCVVKQGDEIKLKFSKDKLKKIKKVLEGVEERPIPNWISVDEDKFIGVINRIPQREDILFPIDETLIVEFYSK